MPVSHASEEFRDQADPLTAECAGREVFNHLTSRWGLLTILALIEGPARFHRLRDSIGGISEKMLSQTLKELTRDGLLIRTVEPTVPPRVTYALSDLGREIAPTLQSIVAWLGRKIEVIAEHQASFDA
jgi:DNA-binding HxlR family transcriptional regulator